MPNPNLSWLIAVFLIVSVYTFFHLRRNRRFMFRRLFRRRRRTSAFQFQPFDVQQTPVAGAGLDASSIAAIPIDYYAAVKLLTNGRVPSDCAVCLTPFEDYETLRLIPNCQHAFHPNCLDPWLRSNATCPTCRARLAPESSSSPPAESTRLHDVVLEVAEEERGVTLGTSPKLLWAHFWKQKTPLRLKILVCQALSGALPLVRHRRCALCGAGGETPEHVFFRCPVARAVWYDSWGIRTDGASTGEWTAANWVEAALFPNRLLAVDLEEEGEVFLFLACLIDQIWALRNRLVHGQEDDVSVQRLKSTVEDSFLELRSAFCVRSGDRKS